MTSAWNGAAFCFRGPCPKGRRSILPSSVWRLTVEDHPVEYGSFEGVIPEGEYGGGTVMLWDRGTWAPEVADVDAALEKGDLKFTLSREKTARVVGAGANQARLWRLEEAAMAPDQASRSLRFHRRHPGRRTALRSHQPLARRNRARRRRRCRKGRQGRSSESAVGPRADECAVFLFACNPCWQRWSRSLSNSPAGSTKRNTTAIASWRIKKDAA